MRQAKVDGEHHMGSGFLDEHFSEPVSDCV